MSTDDLFKKRKGAKKKRPTQSRHLLPPSYLIVCEGTKTEPNYFEGLKRYTESTFHERLVIKKRPPQEHPVISVEGAGKSNERLVEHAIQLRAQSPVVYSHVWVVFDRDDCTNNQFARALQLAKNEQIDVAWSNDAVELWFLLHFEFLNTAISREQYCEKLDFYFSHYKINNGKYEKNCPDLFEFLMEHGQLNRAIKHANRLLSHYADQHIHHPYQMNPGTTVHHLVQELLHYSGSITL